MSKTLTAPGDCPKCELGGFTQPSDLAAHLIDQHDVSGSAALDAARRNFTPAKETSMTCKNCGGDHRSDNTICPKHGGTKAGGGGQRGH